MLNNCNISDPAQLWLKYRNDFSEDILNHARKIHPETIYSDVIYNESLIMIQDKVQALGGPPLRNFQLPNPERVGSKQLAQEILREVSYDVEAQQRHIEQQEPGLTDEQKVAYESILHSVQHKQGQVFFLDAPGGTGKTFVINLLLAKIRQQRGIALAVASSGIAATLLAGGRTAHSTFKLPLNLANTNMPTCNISKGTATAELLRRCKLIVWDESTMAHRGALEALDRSLQDLRDNNRPMGGLTLLLAGDFRQTLPIIPRGSKADEISACLKSSSLWRSIKTIQLTKNMRVILNDDQTADDFTKKLMSIGNGMLPLDKATGLHSLLCGEIVSNQAQLIEKVFPNLHENIERIDWLCERAILAPKNDSVDKTNQMLLNSMPGKVQSYRSIDTVLEEDQVTNYPIEFLNSLHPPGMPPHNLSIKVGAPVMLLRNLDPPKLCNGTRLVVKTAMPHVIEATIMHGQYKGTNVYIPKITIIPSDTPFEFKRLQFPLRLSFSISINKSQGQTIKVVGIDLREPCFAHGQLYVACSRVGDERNLFILAENGKTKNIVYTEILTGARPGTTEAPHHLEETAQTATTLQQRIHTSPPVTVQLIDSQKAVSISKKPAGANQIQYDVDEPIPDWIPHPPARTVSHRSVFFLFGRERPSTTRGWLDDEIIIFFQKQIWEHLRSPCLNSHPDFLHSLVHGFPRCVMSLPGAEGVCVHILPNGAIMQGQIAGICEFKIDHWLCTTINNGMVMVMDSMNMSGCLPTTLEVLLKELYGEVVQVVQTPVQQQRNGSDCGVHSIANGMSVAFGQVPGQARYIDEDLPDTCQPTTTMRQNLWNCIVSGAIEPFPTLASQL